MARESTVKIYYGGDDDWKSYVMSILIDCEGVMSGSDGDYVYASMSQRSINRLTQYQVKGVTFSIVN